MDGRSDSSARGGPFALTPRRPVATTMAVLAVATFGLLSLGKIPIELLPEISYPTITVRTEYEGAGPEDVEERVTEPIEEALAVVPGLERHSSISRAGLSDVQLEFSWGTNLSLATQEIRERLDRVRLPDDAGRPIILRYDPSLDPVLRIAVSSADRPLDEVRRVAEETVRAALVTVPGVAAVKVRGGLEEEIRVTLDQDRLSQLGLDISEVDRRLRIENVNLASGRLVEGDTEYVVRTLNQFGSLDEMMDVAVADRGGDPIRLRDVADVRRTHKERDVVTRIDGREAVELQVFREADANIVAVADAVRERLFGTEEQRRLLEEVESGKREDPEKTLRELLEQRAREQAGSERGEVQKGGEEDREIAEARALVRRLRAAREAVAQRISPGFEAVVVSDQSRFIREAVADVRDAAVLGGLLAVLVLLLFLRDVRATAIVGASIPISVVATFAPMFLAGTTLNIMSLGGLALGIGMLVDNSIVVLESIFRCREEGDERLQAAVRGAREVGAAVFASTMTTIAVFFPITFVSGVAGQLFGDQASTVVYSLLSSLVVALFFIPMLAARGHEGARPARVGEQVRAWIAPILSPSRSVAVRSAAGRSLLARAAAWILPFPLEAAGRLGLALLAGTVGLFRLAFAGVAALLAFPLRPPVRAFDFLYGAARAAYPRALRFLLVRPAAAASVVLFAAAALAWAVLALERQPAQILPTVHQGEIVVRVRTAVGTPVSATSALLLPVERRLAALSDVDLVASSIGVARDEVAEPDEGSHSARILLRLRAADDPAAAEERVERAAADILGSWPEILSYQFTRPTLFSIEAPLEVHALGDDLDAIRRAAFDVRAALAADPRLADVRTNLSLGAPEVRLTFDRERMRRFGLDLEAIANRVRAQIQGVVSTRFVEKDRRIDVRVLSDVDTFDELLEMTVNRGRAVGLRDTLDRGFEGGGGVSGTGSSRIRDRTLLPTQSVVLGGEAPVPLRQVADVEIVRGPSEIRRIGGQRAAVVSAKPSGLDVRSAVESVRRRLVGIEGEHPRVRFAVAGQAANMDRALGDMRSALLLAVFLVYLVMASQFESIVQPFVLLLTVPLAIVGGVAALVLTGTPVSVVVLIGAVVLAGIVVNNAIVLVDYTNQLRRRGLDVVEALVRAGSVRLRPILMTAATTVLALLPLTGAFAAVPAPGPLRSLLRGSELQAPLAICVIGGLTVSTLLTLFVVPIAYRWAVRRSPKESGPAEA